MSATAVLAESPGPPTDARSCVICGSSLEDLDESAEVCGASCRRRRSRLRRLLAGEPAPGYLSVVEVLGGREVTCQPPPKLRRVTRTDLGRRFITEFVVRAPGEKVPGETIRAAYLHWVHTLSPDSVPLSRSAFYEVLHGLGLAEDVEGEPTGRPGRPRLILVGIRLADPPGLPAPEGISTLSAR